MKWLVLVVALAGCKNPRSTDDMTAADLSPLVDQGALSSLCSDPRADAYVLPIVKTSKNGAFNVSLLNSDPGPPIIGSDTWTLLVDDAVNGSPLDGLTISAKPWMPDHGHGTSVVPSVTPAGASGTYSVTPLYLFMAGLWQVTLTIQNGATTDTVVYSFCLSDNGGG